jgi:hypothetical protein
MWRDQMESDHLEEIADDIHLLHKGMKNVIEIVFAISPLLALSTQGWASRSIHSTYLFKVSF